MADERARLLADFVRANLLADKSRPLAADTPLVGGGLVDSMGVVLLAAFVEERFGVRVDDADIRAGALDSVSAILALLDRRR